MLQHERDQRQRLEEMVEQLARQHSNLEKAAKDRHLPRQSKEGEYIRFQRWLTIFGTSLVSFATEKVNRVNLGVDCSLSAASPSDEDDDNEFYDANCDGDEEGDKNDFILKIPIGHRRTSSGVSQGSQVRSHWTL